MPNQREGSRRSPSTVLTFARASPALENPLIMTRIPLQELLETLSAILAKLGFAPDRARTCARLFAETTCDGVYSHGVNRFSRFVAMIHNGCIDVSAEPQKLSQVGGLERWDGKRGPGNLNAQICMERAMTLAHDHGIACVSLRNTNHWMRGGTYGWQAAERGFIAICWTNTLPNLPPWGASQPCLGNNPLVFAVPRTKGNVVLDMAMSQFSHGALAGFRSRGELLPVEGGFDSDGNLTKDPAAIEESQRLLPIGYWKGAGLAMLLDLTAAMLSNGIATHQLPTDPLLETGISQVFISIHPAAFDSQETLSKIADDIVESLRDCKPVAPGQPIRFPGEHTLRTRAENLRLGVPVDEAVWNEILAM